MSTSRYTNYTWRNRGTEPIDLWDRGTNGAVRDSTDRSLCLTVTLHPRRKCQIVSRCTTDRRLVGTPATVPNELILLFFVTTPCVDRNFLRSSVAGNGGLFLSRYPVVTIGRWSLSFGRRKFLYGWAIDSVRARHGSLPNLRYQKLLTTP